MLPSHDGSRCRVAQAVFEAAVLVARTHVASLGGLKGGSTLPRAWTMFAACVLTYDAMPATVLTWGVGNKCVGRRHEAADGSVLHDSHAEVICMRALKRLLWTEICAHTADCDALAACRHPTGLLSHDSRCAQFQLKPGFALHLYISDSPCGSASDFFDTPAPSPGAAPGGGLCASGVSGEVCDGTRSAACRVACSNGQAASHVHAGMPTRAKRLRCTDVVDAADAT
ncbi:hypothetical protein EON66_11890, partial [archaeon]